MGQRIGYHYTSYGCWQQIRKRGLLPYPICKIGLQEHIGNEKVNGIWLWQHRQQGLSHKGCILYQMALKNATQVILLKVEYDSDDILTSTDQPNKIITLHHSGHIENLVYHTEQWWETAVIVMIPISPKQLTVLKEYDLMEIWND